MLLVDVDRASHGNISKQSSTSESIVIQYYAEPPAADVLGRTARKISKMFRSQFSKY